jgi:mycothiol synthase
MIKFRRYESEADYVRIRSFLSETLLLNGLRELNWPVARLDYWRWHVIMNCEACEPVDQVTYLWETPGGQLVAVLNPEDRGEVHFQVHPDYRSPELDQEMLEVAEAKLSVAGPDGRRKLTLWVHAADQSRLALVRSQGYTRGKWVETQRRRLLDAPIDMPAIPAGYVVRSMGGDEDLPLRSWASWRAFHPDAPPDQYEGWEWYLNVQKATSYRKDLDMVAVAPGGEFAAFCTVWYDEASRSACLEPVGTVPEHQRRGLGRAVICEGLRRVQELGAQAAFVSGYTPAANGLYASAGFEAVDQLESWSKVW